jgi:segregation and condensation protein B
MKTLQEREWIRIVGHRDVPGRPGMYATTREFLDYFDLKSLDELPTLVELRDLDTMNAELDLGLPEGAMREQPETDEDAPIGEMLVEATTKEGMDAGVESESESQAILH